MTGSELKKQRGELNHTQESLANELGVTSNTIARWERDEVAIPPYLELALKCLPAKKKESQKKSK